MRKKEAMIQQRTYISQLESKVNCLENSRKRARVEYEQQENKIRQEVEVIIHQTYICQNYQLVEVLLNILCISKGIR